VYFIILKISKISEICSRKKIPNFCHNVIKAFQQHVLHQDLTAEKLQGIHSVLQRHLLNFQAYRPVFGGINFPFFPNFEMVKALS
jgi:hypothetical protein